MSFTPLSKYDGAKVHYESYGLGKEAASSSTAGHAALRSGWASAGISKAPLPIDRSAGTWAERQTRRRLHAGALRARQLMQ